MAVPRGVEPPTFGLGNRFDYRFIKGLRPNVANVLHPFPRDEFLIIILGNNWSMSTSKMQTPRQ